MPEVAKANPPEVLPNRQGTTYNGSKYGRYILKITQGKQ